MAKKAHERNPAPRGAEAKAPEDDAIDVPTLLWALGILAVLILLQRLIWGE